MSKSKRVPELTPPNMSKVRAKILNTQKHAATHEKCVHAQANLQRLKAKYPKVAADVA